jgi:HAD superfamily 5'-nucleotidase-like hydrolase
MTSEDPTTTGELGVPTWVPPPVEQQLPLPLPGLIEPPPVGNLIPRRDRVFANRNLRMAQIDWVGFDMDYTLAIYRQEQMDALSVRLTVERLIRRGYPEFLRALDFDTRFPIRGLLVDKQLGNILKMDRHKFVHKGYHGTRLMDRAEIDALYHNRKLHPEPTRFHWIDTLFALCEATSYAATVTALEQRRFPFDPHVLFDDVRQSIDQAHADGAVYRTVTANPAEYIERDPELPRTLHKLRSAGKRLFILTNSPFHYTDDVLAYLLPPDQNYRDWRQYFEVVVCRARKPAWFSERAPFLVRSPEQPRLEHAREETSTRLEKGRIYEGGSLHRFEKLLGIAGPRVLYVGDHIYGDILRSKKDSTWRTAFVVQELDQEIGALERSRSHRKRRRQLAEARPLLEDQLRFYTAKHKQVARSLGHLDGPAREADARMTLETAREQIERLRTELTRLEAEYEELSAAIDATFHPYFGSLLKEVDGMSNFGQQVETYADVYMRRVSCLSAYSPAQLFRSPHELMAHEL